MEHQVVVDKLRTLIERDTETVVESADELLEIDSFTIVLILAYVHDEWGVTLDRCKLDFAHFKTLNSMADQIVAQASASDI